MNNFAKFILVIFKVLLAVVVLGFFGYIANKNIVFSGNQEIVYDFDENSPFLSPLRPLARTKEITVAPDGRRFQSVITDPVYFDLITFLPFEKAKVEITYRNLSGLPFQLALKRSKFGWNYQIEKLIPISQDGSWQIGQASYDLNNVYRDGKKYSFLLSVPGMTDDQKGEIQISKIKIYLTKKPINAIDFIKSGFKL